MDLGHVKAFWPDGFTTSKQLLLRIPGGGGWTFDSECPDLLGMYGVPRKGEYLIPFDVLLTRPYSPPPKVVAPGPPQQQQQQQQQQVIIVR